MTLREAIDQYKRIIKNPAVFSFSHVPAKIYERREILDIRNELVNFLKFKIPQNTLIVGPSGTGKTLSLMKHKHEIDTDFHDVEIKYVNCRDVYTSYRIITKIARIPLRGISLDEAFQQFFAQQQKHLILVLDEVDKLRDQEIFYNFTRTSEVANRFQYAISLFLISNNPKWKNSIESSILSSLRLGLQYFGIYQPDELVKILQFRAEEGLHSGAYDEGVLGYIAAKTAKEAFSDARIALATLFQSARAAECNRQDKINLANVDAVFGKVNKDIEAENLTKLNPTAFLVLYSCLKSTRKSAKDIFEFYTQFSSVRAQREAVKYVQFHNNLSYLQAQNLVQLWKVKTGNYFVTEIKPTLSLKAAEKELELRIKDERL